MQLYINTTNNNQLEVKAIGKNNKVTSEIVEAKFNQAEILLPVIEKVLEDAKIKLKDLEKIIVNNEGGSFTSLRIGVVTANALAYALEIPVEQTKGKAKKTKGIYIAEPMYDREPNIG